MLVLTLLLTFRRSVRISLMCHTSYTFHESFWANACVVRLPSQQKLSKCDFLRGFAAHGGPTSMAYTAFDMPISLSRESRENSRHTSCHRARGVRQDLKRCVWADSQNLYFQHVD